MCSAVDDEWSQAIVKQGRSVIDGELGERKVAVPIVLTTVGVGAQRVADAAVGPLHHGVGILVVRRVPCPTRGQRDAGSC